MERVSIWNENIGTALVGVKLGLAFGGSTHIHSKVFNYCDFQIALLVWRQVS